MLFRRTTICGARRRASYAAFFLKSRRRAGRVTTLPQPGALSKLAESSGKAEHGQGGPIKQVAPATPFPAPLALLPPTANQLHPDEMGDISQPVSRRAMPLAQPHTSARLR